MLPIVPKVLENIVPISAAISPAVLKKSVKEPSASLVLSIAANLPVFASIKSKNFLVIGSAATRIDSALSHTLPTVPPNELITSAEVLKTSFSLTRFSDFVIESAICCEAVPSAVPTLRKPSLNVGKALSTILCIEVCRIGRKPLAAASFKLSSWGLSPDRNFANVFCESVRPARGSATDTPGVLEFLTFASAARASACALVLSSVRSRSACSASVFLARALTYTCVPATPSLESLSCSFLRSLLRSLA